jgi:hypothetical protein
MRVQDPQLPLDADFQISRKPVVRKQALKDQSTLETANRADVMAGSDIDQICDPQAERRFAHMPRTRRYSRKKLLCSRKGKEAEQEINHEKSEPCLYKKA